MSMPTNRFREAFWTLACVGLCLVASCGTPTDPPAPYRILLVGDTSFGENYQARYEQQGEGNILEEEGYDYPLARLKPFLTNANMVIANLETPITNLPVSPYVGEKAYVHWTDVELAPKHLKRHNILAVSLANNHTLDYGEEGLRQTLDVLHEHGMAGFGAGLDQAAATKPFLKDVRIGERHFKLAVLAAHEYSEKYDRRYRHYAREDRPGVNAISKEKLAKQIARLKENDPTAFVVVYPHWNANYAWKTEAQATLCHALIDAGADLIVGHGAHMMQEIEQYRGRWIVYGLGNFMFNSKGRYQKLNAVPLSLVGQLTLRPTSEGLSKTMRLYPIFTDNRVSKYQCRPVSEAEFEQARDLLLNRSPNPEQLKQEVTAGHDDLGWFLEFPLP